MNRPSSPTSLSSLSRSPEETHTILLPSSTPSEQAHAGTTSRQLLQPQQQQQLRRAKYIKVGDLATMNQLDIEKITLDTVRKQKQQQQQQQQQQEEMKHDHVRCGTEAMVRNKIKDVTTTTSTSSSFHSSEKKETTSIKGEEQSICCSTDADHKDSSRLLQRMVPFTGGFNLCLLVRKVNIVVDKVRVDKSQVRLAECEVGDETGTLSLRARDGQISLLEDICKQKAAVVLRNCSIELYQGKYLRLAVSKWGKIAMYPDGIDGTPCPPTMINGDIHLSIPSLFDIVANDWLESHAKHDGCAPTKRDSAHQTNPRHKVNKHSKIPPSYPFYMTMPHHFQQHPGGLVVGGYNTNVGQAQLLNPYTRQIYNPNMNISPYGYGQVQPSYLHPPPPLPQQQQFQQFIDHGGYIHSYPAVAPDYTMHLQMEAMTMSYQHQYHRNMPQAYATSNQDYKRYPQQVMERRQMYGYYNHTNQSDGYSRDSPQASISEGKTLGDAAATCLAPLSQLSPDQNKNPSIDSNEMLSLRLEAKSPMMNPNAAVFTASSPAYNLPSKIQYHLLCCAFLFTKHAS